ncbi:molybdate ABC transporter substrate-binding protein [Staphylococcus hyicus]|uniref:molybdate ABC transporter substrate-binding protein n=1 Tax=Staphylococcus hyicus TaxID=1284 RepID=UPI00208EB960|nr:molybdate ABC transporter substrate-binding protein [Staphylococcus hyicus]MCO4328780.1 molybdate ABC transporter substrate-binding protein [Staphylococcus hyicus]MCO4331086.1 molybdate ABC transporter substrate-binding protein [Staphylococcus hyicus]MCO4333383.1 molybdate ABC transporter substrate-binding protein [Staphylococcus hyicus]MCO4336842.1 molybdate ABC transporter substrate-binding protein [Staphylococcus hyicus]
MKRIVFLGLTIIGLLCLVAGCGNKAQQNDENNHLTISAAASLTDVTKELEKAFKKEHPNAVIEFNYGGSGALRQQIEKGAPVDVFMSANTKDVKTLKTKGKVKASYAYAHNKLILIKQRGASSQSLDQLQQNTHVAMGEVASVPAGKYAKMYLESQGLWKKVEPHVVYTKDVREVLNYVDKGNAQYGFVYQTDLYAGNTQDTNVEKVKDAQLKQPITYEMGRISDDTLSKAWVTFMKSKQAQSILKQYHFEQ